MGRAGTPGAMETIGALGTTTKGAPVQEDNYDGDLHVVLDILDPLTDPPRPPSSSSCQPSHHEPQPLIATPIITSSHTHALECANSHQVEPVLPPQISRPHTWYGNWIYPGRHRACLTAHAGT